MPIRQTRRKHHERHNQKTLFQNRYSDPAGGPVRSLLPDRAISTHPKRFYIRHLVRRNTQPEICKVSAAMIKDILAWATLGKITGYLISLILYSLFLSLMFFTDMRNGHTYLEVLTVSFLTGLSLIVCVAIQEVHEYRQRLSRYS